MIDEKKSESPSAACDIVAELVDWFCILPLNSEGGGLFLDFDYDDDMRCPTLVRPANTQISHVSLITVPLLAA